ncbi:T-cell-specific guanine nucleotide triphosphate-binding protein 2-like [Mercenaria mercenaria]|uniref:T-cell-specific guanine nucleotide triphosphate-binding protein 2-like n=1 Tax=Mercenaria mercenaria TaxID=6596 RepID=UPI00234FB1C1|nr:T-cell-specific guanine nucleotide triphosphate-binding protein 2-like [Mercenaria mercenaria]
MFQKAIKAKDFFSSKGVVGLHQYLKDELETLKNVDINLAVTGSSGTGKSSFINAVRNLSADNEGAAEVGVVETTMEPNSFAHPYRQNLKLWDLPGVGTVRVPKDRYLKNISFEKYDFVIIMSKCRITENEVWLARTLNSMKLRLAFVRTHIDDDVANERRQFPKRDDVITRIRSNCEVELQTANLPFIPVFLIDNFEKNAYPDFARLEQYMLSQCNLQKNEILLSCISDLARDVIEAKKKHMKTRIPSICDEIANIGSYAEQNNLLRHELNEFKSYFHLDLPSLKIDVMYTNFSDDDMQNVLNILDEEPPEIIQLVDALTSSTRGIPIYGKYKIKKACRHFLTSSLNKLAKISIKTTDTMVRGMKILQE